MATSKESKVSTLVEESAKDYRSHHYNFRLNDQENVQFKCMFEESGAHTMTKFIVGRLFSKEFRV